MAEVPMPPKGHSAASDLVIKDLNPQQKDYSMWVIGISGQPLNRNGGIDGNTRPQNY